MDQTTRSRTKEENLTIAVTEYQKQIKTYRSELLALKNKYDVSEAHHQAEKTDFTRKAQILAQKVSLSGQKISELATQNEGLKKANAKLSSNNKLLTEKLDTAKMALKDTDPERVNQMKRKLEDIMVENREFHATAKATVIEHCQSMQQNVNTILLAEKEKMNQTVKSIQKFYVIVTFF